MRRAGSRLAALAVLSSPAATLVGELLHTVKCIQNAVNVVCLRGFVSADHCFLRVSTSSWGGAIWPGWGGYHLLISTIGLFGTSSQHPLLATFTLQSLLGVLCTPSHQE